MNRRQLIQGALSLTVLSLGGISAYQLYLDQQLNYSEKLNTEFLQHKDQLILQVFIPIFAAGMPVKPDIKQSIINIDQAVLRLPLQTQDELRQLFSLLGNGIGRLVAAGVWSNWQQASFLDCNVGLNNLREHKFKLLQQAYIGLHKLIIGSLYAQDVHWPDIGYPGPIKLR